MKSIGLILLSICWLTACNPELVNQDDSKNSNDQHDRHIESVQKAQKISLSIPNTIDWSQFKHAAYDRHTILAKPILKHTGKSQRSQTSLLNINRYLSKLNVQVIEVPHGVDPLVMIEDLRATGNYEYVEPNFQVTLTEAAVPLLDETMMIMSESATNSSTDPLASYQWNMNTIGQSRLPAEANGKGITVAVIDTGVALNGQDAPINILSGYDFINDDTDAHDDNGHGTHVAGTIAQATANQIGVIGMSPEVDILPVKVLNAAGTGSYAAIADGIVYAVDQGAHVINMSLGGPVSASVLADAVQYAHDRGVIIVAATGNDGSDTTISYPAAYEHVVAVGSIGYNEARAYYSNAGSAIDFVAPGGDMTADRNGDGYPDGILQETLIGGNYNYYFFQGTSMASPHIAASYALLLGAGATATQADTALRGSIVDLGDSGWDSDYGYGLPQIDVAYQQIQNEDDTDKKDDEDGEEAGEEAGEEGGAEGGAEGGDEAGEEGGDEADEEEPQLLDAMMIRTTNRNVQVRVWPFRNMNVTLCLQRADGSEKCRTKAPREMRKFGGGLQGMRHYDGEYESITVSVQNAAGETQKYGPFDLGEMDYIWKDQVRCASDIQVDALEARFKSSWGENGLLQVRFNNDQDAAILVDGVNRNGDSRTKWGWKEAGDNRFGFGVLADQQEFTLQVRDALGCSANFGPYPMPSNRQWQGVE